MSISGRGDDYNSSLDSILSDLHKEIDELRSIIRNAGIELPEHLKRSELSKPVSQADIEGSTLSKLLGNLS